MPRYNERSTRQSRFSEDEEPRSTSRRPAAGGRGAASRGKQKEQVKQVYVPIFALFGTEHANGRLQVDVKTFQGNDASIEDHLSLDEFLFFCEKLYYGETKLTGSMWECDEKFASMSGNVRFTEEQIEELKEEYAAQAGSGKAAANKKKAAPATATKAKSRYVVPEEDDEEEEFEEEEFEEVVVKPYVANQGKKRTPVKPAVELDMETEEVGAEEETEPPY